MQIEWLGRVVVSQSYTEKVTAKTRDEITVSRSASKAHLKGNCHVETISAALGT